MEIRFLLLSINKMFPLKMNKKNSKNLKATGVFSALEEVVLHKKKSKVFFLDLFL